MDFSKNQSSKTQTQSQKAIEQAAKTAQKSSHKVELDHLHAMSVTGVEDVPTFTDKTVVIRLKGETLTVSGQNLAVKILTSPRENCKSRDKSTLSNTRRRPPLLRLQNAFSNDSIVSRGKRKSAGNLLCALLCGRDCRRRFRVVVHKKAGFFERALLDLFATGVIGAIFICCIEFFMQGLPSFYGVLAYVSGTAVLPLIVKKSEKSSVKKHIKP